MNLNSKFYISIIGLVFSATNLMASQGNIIRFYRSLNHRLDSCHSYTSDKKFELIQGYVLKVVTMLTEKNPGVFIGPFLNSEFCIIVEQDEYASSYPAQGILNVGPKLFVDVKSDSEVAAVIAHELGHILGQHNALGDPEIMLQDQTYIDLIAERDRFYRLFFAEKIAFYNLMIKKVTDVGLVADLKSLLLIAQHFLMQYSYKSCGNCLRILRIDTSRLHDTDIDLKMQNFFGFCCISWPRLFFDYKIFLN